MVEHWNHLDWTWQPWMLWSSWTTWLPWWPWQPWMCWLSWTTWTPLETLATLNTLNGSHKCGKSGLASRFRTCGKFITLTTSAPCATLALSTRCCKVRQDDIGLSWCSYPSLSLSLLPVWGVGFLLDQGQLELGRGCFVDSYTKVTDGFSFILLHSCANGRFDQCHSGSR